MSFPLVWDSTILSTFSACPRKFFHSQIEHLKPVGTSHHLVFGGAFAKGLETARKNFYSLSSPAESAIALGLAAATVEWEKSGLPIEPDPALGGKTFDGLVDSFLGYFDQYPLGSDRLRPHFFGSKPMIEVSFCLPLADDLLHPITGEPICYAGRFDMLAEDDGVLWVVDEKTGSMAGPTWADKWHMRGQFSGYVWGAQSFGLPVAGAIIRGIIITKSGNISYPPAITYRPQWHIDRWKAGTISKIRHALNLWRATDFYLAEDDACSSYGGCVYQRLCTSPSPEPLKSMYYEYRVWDPLNRTDD